MSEEKEAQQQQQLSDKEFAAMLDAMIKRARKVANQKTMN